MQLTKATEHYRGMFTSRTPEEFRTLAHIKRFMERLVGDPGFRQELADHIDEPRPVAERYGIDLDPLDLQPLWDRRYLRFRRQKEAERWPLAGLWDRYMDQMIMHRDLMRLEGSTAESHPVFHAWRERQVQRSESELGGSAPAVTHPLIAFELSEGCTVGCWFCGLSAERFKGYFPYTPENSALWRGMVTVVNDVFGSASSTGFCYWATDPCDNPDYDRFLEDYYHITGTLPQTTTAAPLKDEALTRRVLRLFEQYRTVTNRFSVLTVKHLNKIHAAFTPEELMGVELVLQNKEALATKADAGRAKTLRQTLRAAGKSDRIDKMAGDHTTIACVSGFLVNMMERKVRLVTPVPGSTRWPLGYRVIGERQFDGVSEFRAALEALIETHAKPILPPDEVVQFRPDLRYEALEKGFILRARGMYHSFNNAECGRQIGDMIAAGRYTPGDIVEALATEGINVFVVAHVLDSLFRDGLIDEYRDIDAAADLAAKRADAVEELAN
jgi:radical SAM family RiPP maturation amino acid epimerase